MIRTVILLAAIVMVQAGACFSADAARTTLRVMTFNVWHGGDAGGQPLSQTVEVIRRSQADIVGIQESHGQEVNGVRPDHGAKIAEQLGWHFLGQEDRRCIVSRFPIDRATAGKWGVEIEYRSGHKLTFFNVHFAASPYQPYQLLEIPYGDYPFITTESQAIEWANKGRGDQVSSLVKEMQGPVSRGGPVVLTGDFNEPSCLDWTEKSRKAGLCPVAVDYPATRRVIDVGMKDTWRSVHKDEVREPGFTWTPVTRPDDPADHHDRIDFVFAAGTHVRVTASEVMGEASESADLVVTPWPSDHRAVVTTLTIAAPTTVSKNASSLKPHPDAVPNQHAAGEVDRPELVPFVVKDAGTLPGVVVDETQATLEGTWQYSTHTPPYVGLGYLHDQKRGKGRSSVTFTPQLPESGIWEVRLSHCYNVRRSTNTPVTIHHADGETTLRINQQQIPKHDRLFRPLGRFSFDAGRSGWVRISTEGTAGKYVIADAVQFLKVTE